MYKIKYIILTFITKFIFKCIASIAILVSGEWCEWLLCLLFLYIDDLFLTKLLL